MISNCVNSSSSLSCSSNNNNFTLQELAAQFHLPLHEAALALNLSLHELRRQCRDHGITRWPYKTKKNSKQVFSSFDFRLSNGSNHGCYNIEQQQLCYHTIVPHEMNSQVPSTSTASPKQNCSSSSAPSTPSSSSSSSRCNQQQQVVPSSSPVGREQEQEHSSSNGQQQTNNSANSNSYACSPHEVRHQRQYPTASSSSTLYFGNSNDGSAQAVSSAPCHSTNSSHCSHSSSSASASSQNSWLATGRRPSRVAAHHASSPPQVSCSSNSYPPHQHQMVNHLYAEPATSSSASNSASPISSTSCSSAPSHQLQGSFQVLKGVAARKDSCASSPFSSKIQKPSKMHKALLQQPQLTSQISEQPAKRVVITNKMMNKDGKEDHTGKVAASSSYPAQEAQQVMILMQHQQQQSVLKPHSPLLPSQQLHNHEEGHLSYQFNNYGQAQYHSSMSMHYQETSYTQHYMPSSNGYACHLGEHVHSSHIPSKNGVAAQTASSSAAKILLPSISQLFASLNE